MSNLDMLKKHKNELMERRKEAMREIILRNDMALESKTHAALLNSTGEKYKSMALEICNGIINEYGCKTQAEKMLAEIATSAYIRYITWAKSIEVVEKDGRLMKKMDDRIASIGKEMERSAKTYRDCMLTFSKLKKGSGSFKLNTKTAFIAQKQQINVVHSKRNNKGLR